MRSERILNVWVLALLTVVLAAGAAHGQRTSEYTIGQGDALSVSVWRHPELERTVIVGANGMVTFPPIGDVVAAGLTPTELSREIMQRLRDYTRETTQVTVTVSQFNSRAIFLTGQVAAPGRYSFEALPNVLELLSQAGGPLPSADLSKVSIIRSGAGGPEVIRLDVGRYMRGEATEPLPQLQPGDMVEVPSVMGGTGGMGGQGLVYIFGEVRAPGAYSASEGTDLLQLIALAGGSTPDARLNEVAVVMNGGDGQVVARVDLKGVIEHGTRSPFMVSGGDRVFVPGDESNLAGQILNTVSTVFGYTGDLMSTYLLYLTLDEERAQKEERDAAN